MGPKIGAGAGPRSPLKGTHCGIKNLPAWAKWSKAWLAGMNKSSLAGEDAPGISSSPLLVAPVTRVSKPQGAQGCVNIEPSSSTLECPVKHSFITNWDDMKKTWYHSFYNKSPKLRPSFFIEVPIFKADREKKLGGSSLHRRQTGSTIESSVQLPARVISILSA